MLKDVHHIWINKIRAIVEWNNSNKVPKCSQDDGNCWSFGFDRSRRAHEFADLNSFSSLIYDPISTPSMMHIKSNSNQIQYKIFPQHLDSSFMMMTSIVENRQETRLHNLLSIILLKDGMNGRWLWVKILGHENCLHAKSMVLLLFEL